MLVTAGGFYVYLKILDSNIKTGDLHSGGVGPNTVAEHAGPNGQLPINVLVIGSDSRNNAEDVSLGGSQSSVGGAPHADVEMLVHISADRTNASITSIPRDTFVHGFACGGKTLPFDRITDTLAHGPGCVLDTWESVTGVHIDNWVMLDFSGVVKMADAIGGVQVRACKNVYDYYVYRDAQGVRHEEGSHLELPGGPHTIYGIQALEWLRTRHAFGDGTDPGRTAAQHQYLNSMIRKFKSAGTLLNPAKLNSLAVAATTSVKTSPGLGSIEAMSGLALEFNKVPSNRVTTTTIPFSHMTEPGYTNPNNWVPIFNDQTKQLFQMIANDIPLDKNGAAPSASASPSPTATPVAVDKAGIALTVENASATVGRGKAMAEHLVSLGFSQAQRSTKPVTGTTELTYPTADKAQAEAVAAALGLTPGTLKASASATGLTLKIGTEWPNGDDYRSTLPKQGTLPTGTDAQNAQDDSGSCMPVAPGHTWTSSTPPVVPQPAGYRQYTTP
ncbi:LCP family protein [Streptacidiphilus rugosus]|uniref:LCP family protein n=1 Tax=Streptacidiphilus rugosus TaxID=405783 RepID=UPI00068C4693|nr:LCP family protein [Streptacidiphilus rugosus]